MAFCPACGAQNAEEAKFCTSCGRPLVAAVPPPPPVTPSSPAVLGKPAANPIAHLGLWGCLLILTGFFLPWINLGVFGNISGYNIVAATRGIINSPDQTGISVFILVTAIITIAAALICLLYLVGLGIGRGAFILFKLIPLLALIAEVVYIYYQARNAPDELEDAGWQVLGVGLYLTFAGAFLLAISKSKR